ncbi:duodenase-1-like isoform X2 [Lates calcarifer]|uniref:trypsin n=1 Tax=Lates calcarifer TaxID=8187 RepID=A0AAJ8B0I5_LATCA|nr:duodenase-1-like isoform X2 [Lates calcarifer]
MHGLHKFLLFPLLMCLGRSVGSRIIHGNKVSANSMLYMVSVQNNRGHICGGFLVREDFVVTAAHCNRDEPTSVVFGTHNLKNTDNGKRINIETRYKHPQFMSEGTGNDIMLLKLSKKVQLDNSAQTIHLPSSEMHINDNQQCRVAGWGYTRTNGNVVDDLRVVDVSIINPQVCKMEWDGLPANVICAGGYGTNKGFCQGDSGGPLVCNGIAVGVVSFNKYRNCNYPDVPNVYTDISKYLVWINSIISLPETL